MKRLALIAVMAFAGCSATVDASGAPEFCVRYRDDVSAVIMWSCVDPVNRNVCYVTSHAIDCLPITETGLAQ